jgi:hypothetical protein
MIIKPKILLFRNTCLLSLKVYNLYINYNQFITSFLISCLIKSEFFSSFSLKLTKINLFNIKIINYLKKLKYF